MVLGPIHDLDLNVSCKLTTFTELILFTQPINDPAYDWILLKMFVQFFDTLSSSNRPKNFEVPLK